MELFTGQENQWVLREASGVDAAIALPGLEVTLALSEIYAKVGLLTGQTGSGA